MKKGKIVLFLAFLSVFLLSSCNIVFVQEYDEETKRIIEEIKYNYEEVANIQHCNKLSGCTQDITVKKDANGLYQINFWIGSGCGQSGCPNRHIWYFTYSNGVIKKVSEDARGVDPVQ